MKICQTKKCRNIVKKCKVCSTCRSRKSRENNRAKYCYNNLKSNAKRRKKIFELSFEQFLLFCRKTNYLSGVGKTKESYTIDCIVAAEGYILPNICILPLKENSAKNKKVLVYDWESKYATVMDVYKEYLDSQEIDNPF